MFRHSPLAFACIFSLVSAAAADKKVSPVRAGNDIVDATAAIVMGKDNVKALLGVDPEVDLVIADVTLRPKGDTKLKFSRDAFTLISRKDGQRIGAMHPSQVAGSAVLVVSSTQAGAGGGVMTPRRGPIWGGVPGTGDRPRRIGGDEDGVVSGSTEGKTDATLRNDAKENPALAALKAKELRFEPAEAEVKGLLYFILEGKHKLKDLELMYKTAAGTLTLDFEK